MMPSIFLEIILIIYLKMCISSEFFSRRAKKNHWLSRCNGNIPSTALFNTHGSHNHSILVLKGLTNIQPSITMAILLPPIFPSAIICTNDKLAQLAQDEWETYLSIVWKHDSWDCEFAPNYGTCVLLHFMMVSDLTVHQYKLTWVGIVWYWKRVLDCKPKVVSSHLCIRWMRFLGWKWVGAEQRVLIKWKKKKKKKI